MANNNLQTDILIIGAGIIGVVMALELKKSFPDQSIQIIEKESLAGFHASGRNSGILHAGFYYTADSLKARFCRDGNRAMTQYCLENNLTINRCGKLVITKHENELKTLQTLYDRGIHNGVNLKLITAEEAREIEPRVRTVEKAIFSPDTASVDPVEVMASLVKKVEEKNIKINYDEPFISNNLKDKIVITNKRKIKTGFVVNAAGLYADKIARQYGFSQHYEIMPFKGLYLYSNDVGALKTHVYPVPDLNYPFLGVHFTKTVSGDIKIGPTATPAFWRENYTNWEHFDVAEFFTILGFETKLFLSNAFNFRELAIEEMKKYNKNYFISLAKNMVQQIDPAGFTEFTKPGIRAQLLDKTTLSLVQDFVVEADRTSVHVLNAVSPAFTCAFPFSQFVVSNYILK